MLSANQHADNITRAKIGPVDSQSDLVYFIIVVSVLVDVDVMYCTCILSFVCNFLFSY